MVPRLAAQGASFQGAFLYYFHDKSALTQGRIAWTETLNLLTDKVEKAWKVMAFTAKYQERLKEASGQNRSGAKLKKPVLAYSLAWHPEQKPDREAMMNAARTSLEQLGLSDHEAMIACHTDEPQPHIHIVVNKVHPRTGIVATLKHTKRKLSDWARKFQEQEGTDYCPKRKENHEKRKNGMTTTYGDPVIVNAWNSSEDAQGFAGALKAEGYRLTQGRKRLIVIDRYGKAHNPVRHLKDEGVRAKDFNERMKDFEPKQREQPNQPEPSATESSEEPNTQPLEDYKAKAAVALFNQLQQQRKELENLDAQFDRKRNQKQKLLATKYEITERQANIDALTKKLETTNPIQRWTQKLFLLEPKITKQRATLQTLQETMSTRINASLERIESDHLKALTTLEKRQSTDREKLTAQLEKWRPKRLATCENVAHQSRSRTKEIGSPLPEGPNLSR